MPYNYWMASIKNGRLIFDSWDGASKKRLKKNPFLYLIIFFLFIRITTVKKLKTKMI